MVAELSKLLDKSSFFSLALEKMLLSKDLVGKPDVMHTIEFVPIYF